MSKVDVQFWPVGGGPTCHSVSPCCPGGLAYFLSDLTALATAAKNVVS